MVNLEYVLSGKSLRDLENAGGVLAQDLFENDYLTISGLECTIDKVPHGLVFRKIDSHVTKPLGQLDTRFIADLKSLAQKFKDKEVELQPCYGMTYDCVLLKEVREIPKYNNGVLTMKVEKDFARSIRGIMDNLAFVLYSVLVKSIKKIGKHDAAVYAMLGVDGNQKQCKIQDTLSKSSMEELTKIRQKWTEIIKDLDSLGYRY